ncbi:hypothetical protein QU42_18990 [Bradyrhizobium sp. UASWS1016]|jgi:hypothetical protein|nr:hypothetical protein QU41_21250 [Bradyrhizobium elkanii]OCX29749.1 hypothetical protein QU42_18990 [Bradyrhizobium sp. UASWS1016]
MGEIVKINWRAIAISEWQSFDFARRFNHATSLTRGDARNILAEISADLAINCCEVSNKGKMISWF